MKHESCHDSEEIKGITANDDPVDLGVFLWLVAEIFPNGCLCSPHSDFPVMPDFLIFVAHSRSPTNIAMLDTLSKRSGQLSRL